MGFEFDPTIGDLKEEIRLLRLEMELTRDFIIYLCEEEIEDTVTECHDRFEKWEEKNNSEEIKTQP